MDEGRLALVLTRLAGGPQLCADELDALAESDWDALDARAAEHRLRPLLHARWQHHRKVPEALRARWAQACRDSALETLGQRRTLIALVGRLADEGIEVLALKGAYVAWHCYRTPALRPMRDLDLLVRPGDAAKARALLLADGWSEPEGSALEPEAWLAQVKHLPELVSPEGHWLDLHTRLWDDKAGFPPMPDAIWSRAVADGEVAGLRYPAPEDMLMHLVLHALAHRFDAGPLLLTDIDRLIAHHRFDWPAVTARAQREGWERPLALVLAATRHWGSQGLWYGPDTLAPVPPELVEDVPHLLAKPLAARAADIGAAKRARGLGAIGRVLARRGRYERTGDYLGWVAGEARLALAARGDTGLAERRMRIARLDAWLAS